MLVVRLPLKSSLSVSINQHQLDALERIHSFADEEYSRVQEEMKKHRHG